MANPNSSDLWGGEKSLVRENLMTRQGYSPYCSSDDCILGWPRTTFDGEQFKCRCGFRTQFDAEFMARYKVKWRKP